MTTLSTSNLSTGEAVAEATSSRMAAACRNRHSAGRGHPRLRG